MRLRQYPWTKRRHRRGAQVLATVLIATHFGSAAEPADDIHHPRLYFTAADLPQLRELKKTGTHAEIWANMIRSADWCAKQPPRTEWIASVENDPQFENLYDRFYAAMHDAAIVEHLVFTSTLSNPNDDSSYERGGIVVAMKNGGLIVHAGGERVLVDRLEVNDTSAPAKPVGEVLLADDGRHATIRCVGAKTAGIGQQLVDLGRPSNLSITRATEKPLTWWYSGNPQHKGNLFTWPNGTQLRVVQGKISRIEPEGYVESKRHFGGMKFADPHPFTYSTMTVAPENGNIVVEVSSSSTN